MSYSQQGQEPKPMPSVEQSLKSVGWHAKEMNDSQKGILNELKMLNITMSKLLEVLYKPSQQPPAGARSSTVIPF